MNIFTVVLITSVVWIVVILVLYMIGKPTNENKPATKDTIYGERVIKIAAQIYCNYSDSRIIRPGVGPHAKKPRYGEAIQEALNLVGSANNYFDLIDKGDQPKKKIAVVEKMPIKDVNIN